MHDYLDPLERAEAAERDELVGELIRLYASRRLRGAPTRLQVLVERAAAHSPEAAVDLRDAIDVYEALLAHAS